MADFVTGTSALIPVFTGTLSNSIARLCDARALHAFMHVKRDFATWAKARIKKYGFIAGIDYVEVFTKSGENLGGRPSIDYHLTLDMAKELSMVENNDMGRQARRYFIECEAAATHPARISPAQPAPARSRTPRDYKGEPLPLPTVILEPARAMLDAAVWRMTGQVREQLADWAARRLADSCRLDLADDLQYRAESAIDALTLDDFLTCGEASRAAVLLSLAETMAFAATEQAQRLRKTLASFPLQGVQGEASDLMKGGAA